MKLNKTMIALLIAMMSLLTVQPSLAAINTPAAQLRRTLENIHSMTANFSQRIYNGRGKLLRSSRGFMAIQRPNKFRWAVTSPSTQLIVANGRTVWVYDKGLQQASVRPFASSVNRTPARLLSGKLLGLGRAFYVTFNKGWYILKPRSSSSFQQIMMRFQGTRLIAMRLRDKLGQASVVSFANVRVNRRLSSRLFSFKPPRGVDVIRAK